VKLILKHSAVVFTSCCYTLLDRAFSGPPFVSPYSMPIFFMWVSVEKVALQLVFFSEYFGLPLWLAFHHLASSADSPSWQICTGPWRFA